MFGFDCFRRFGANPIRYNLTIMKKSVHQFAAVMLLAGFGLVSSSAYAQKPTGQKSIGAAVQQGNGAYVSKTASPECMGNSLLGVPTLPASACVNMNQVKFIVTPSGNSTSVWKGIVPAESRPKERVIFNSTYTEVTEGITKGQVYNTTAVTEPSGEVTLTLTLKGNGKGGNDGRKG